MSSPQRPVLSPERATAAEATSPEQTDEILSLYETEIDKLLRKIDEVTSVSKAKADDKSAIHLCCSQIKTIYYRVAFMAKEKALYESLFNKLSKQLEKTNAPTHAPTYAPTYAAMAAGAASKGARSTNFLPERREKPRPIILKPVGDFKPEVKTEVADEVLKLLGTNTVKVNSYWMTREKRVVVEADSVEDKIAIEKAAAKSTKIVVEPLKLKLPKIIIYGVKNEITEDTLISSFMHCGNFPNVNNLDSLANEVKVCFRKNKTETASNYVIQLPHPLWRNIVQKGRIYLGWLSLRAADYLLPTRCNKCMGFHHYAASCSHSEVVCHHCAESHMKKSCPNLSKPPVCAVCLRRNRPANHSPFSKLCQEFQRALEIERSKILFEE